MGLRRLVKVCRIFMHDLHMLPRLRNKALLQDIKRNKVNTKLGEERPRKIYEATTDAQNRFILVFQGFFIFIIDLATLYSIFFDYLQLLANSQVFLNFVFCLLKKHSAAEEIFVHFDGRLR